MSTSNEATGAPLNLTEAVTELLAGTDPAQVIARYKPDAEDYRQFLTRERATIRRHTKAALKEFSARISSAERVALAKLLHSERIHRPFVEEGLRDSARKQASEVGLSPDVAEDMVLFMLAKAREAQENLATRFAADLARSKQLLQTDRAAPATGEFNIDPISSRADYASLAREENLSREFHITPALPEFSHNYERLLQLFEAPHEYIKRGLIVGMRDFALVADALREGKPVTVVAGAPGQGRMTLQHSTVALLLGWLQSLGAKLTLVVRDLEASASGEVSLEAARAHAQSEFLARLSRFGVNLETAEIIFQRDDPQLAALALEAGAHLSLANLNAAFGLRLQSQVVEVYRPLLRTAELLLPASKDGVRTAFVGTLDQDIYVRMARRHAADVGWPRPVALYIRAVAGLHPYIDQATGSYVDVMKPESETTSIYLDESAQAVATKLKRALTGGGRTKEEHAALGGNPDTRLCSISSLLAFFLADSAEEHAQIADECRRGVRFCGDCKRLCLERLGRLPLDENAG